jgi:hypothetical protein
MKNSRLSSPMPKEKFLAKLAGTQQARGREKAPPAEPKIGDKMPDGTIYTGISPDTNRPMYVMPADAPLSMTFNEASEYVKAVNSQEACGDDDWRLPTKKELDHLFNNLAAIGGFDVSGSYPAGWYWSATPGKWGVWCQRFSDGDQCNGIQVDRSSVRLVR